MIFKINNYVFEYPKPRFDLTLAIIKYLEFKVNETVSELEALEEAREIAGIGKTFKGNNGHEFDFKVVFNENRISNLVKKLDSLAGAFSQLTKNRKLPANSSIFEAISYINETLIDVDKSVTLSKRELYWDISNNDLSPEKINIYMRINDAISNYNAFIDELEKIFVQDSYGFNIVFNKNDKLYNILMNTARYKIEILNIPENPIIGENLACEEKL